MADDYWTPAFQLMLEEARRSIDRQSERVQHVRERAVALVGFGSIVAAALGLSDNTDLGAAGLVGVVAFVVVAATALFVLIPRQFMFELSARRIDGWFKLPTMSDLNRLCNMRATGHRSSASGGRSGLGGTLKTWPSSESRSTPT